MSVAVDSPLTKDAYRLKAFEIWGGSDAVEHQRLTVPGFEAYVHSAPHEGGREGGDLRFISACAMGQILRVTLADIAGHGAEAADWAVRLRTLIRKHINTPNPEKFARALNWEFSRLAEAGGFATAVITTYFAPTDHLIVCNAGHPRPILFHADENRWELFDQSATCVLPSDRAGDTGVSGLPLGVIAPTNYPMFATRLSRGDVVVAYTDALIEATDTHGNQLGEEGLLAIISRLGMTDPERLGPAVLDEVSRFRAGRPADDDTTLIVLRHNAIDPPDGPVARLKALGRLVGLVD